MALVDLCLKFNNFVKEKCDIRMKRILLFVAMSFVLLACAQQDQEFVPIDLTIEDIEIEPVGKFSLYADVPKDGAEFSVTGVGKYAERTHVSLISVDGHTQNDPSKPMASFNGDWGSFEQNGNTIAFVLSPNNGDKVRTIEFTIGGGYWVRFLRIRQMKD